MPDLERTYTTEEVAKRYRRSVDSVVRWVRQGRITAINPSGGRFGPYVFRQKDLDEFDERNLVSATAKRDGTARRGSVRKKTVTRKGKQYTYWEARYTVGHDPGTGKQIQRSISGKTEAEVAQKLKEVTASITDGTYNDKFGKRK